MDQLPVILTVLTTAVQAICVASQVTRDLLDTSLECTNMTIDDDDNETMEILVHMGERRVNSRVDNFVDDVVDKMDDEQFMKNFRLSRKTVKDLEKQIKQEEELLAGRPTITLRKQVLMYLEYMANGAKTLREIGMLYGVADATVLKYVKKTAKSICNLRERIITWPTGQKSQETMKSFESIAGIPGVLGALDGSHIPIKCPAVCPESYFNRKKFYSIVLQAVCDHNMFFTDVFIGWPGSSHDATILANSELFNKMERDREFYFPDNSHLIADKAYPLSPTLITPFKDNELYLSSNRKIFNKCHSSSRILIERAFGTMKGRFRRLMYPLDMTDLGEICEIGMSACILHNIALKSSSDCVHLDEYFQEADESINIHNQGSRLSTNNQPGSLKRDHLVMQTVQKR